MFDTFVPHQKGGKNFNAVYSKWHLHDCAENSLMYRQTKGIVSFGHLEVHPRYTPGFFYKKLDFEPGSVS